jgi:hypothetical protein
MTQKRAKTRPLRNIVQHKEATPFVGKGRLITNLGRGLISRPNQKVYGKGKILKIKKGKQLAFCPKTKYVVN